MEYRVKNIPIFKPIHIGGDTSVAFYRDSNFSYFMSLMPDGKAASHVRDNDQIVKFDWRTWRSLLKGSHEITKFIFEIEWLKIFKA
jgi:hypothetical protein